MTQHAISRTDRLATIRRYRRLMYGSVVVGSLGLAAASRFDYHLLGVGIYWTGVAAFFAIWRGTSVPLFDERDAAIERRASMRTLQVVAAAGIVGIPSAVALAELGYYAMPPELAGAIYAYVGLVAVFAVAYGWTRFRS
ncbi:MAG TPA: DUF2178 domain-containing protein [Halobacteriales archaeon]|nr:DUF2178 domain-containing protein [Halobacteriales archaeon]